jgi:hypothetical protein
MAAIGRFAGEWISNYYFIHQNPLCMRSFTKWQGHVNHILPYFQNKRLLLFSLLTICITALYGQSIPSRYKFTSSSGVYTAITGGTVWQSGTTLGTNTVTNVSLPFDFNFNGSDYNAINISNNGFITFGATAPGVTNYAALSISTAFSGAVVGYGFNLVNSSVSGTSPEIRYEQVGSEFIIQFQDLGRTGITGDRMNFQIRLEQTTNTIRIVYGTWAATTTTSSDANFGQTGIRGANNLDYSGRTVNATAPYNSWANSGGSQATLNTNTGTMRYNNAYLPASGLTYMWTVNNSYAPLPYSQNFEAAPWASRNSLQDSPDATYVSTSPQLNNPAWKRHDETTANSLWGSTSGPLAALTGSQGTGVARFHSYNASSGAKGYLDIYLDFSTVGSKNLTFDYQNSTGTDNLQVALSTDGGLTFSNVGTAYSTSAAWTTQSISLSVSNSSTCVLRFIATSDFGDNDIGLDNVSVTVLTDAVDWCNLQHPPSGSINEGGTFDVYGQAWEPGVTDAPGQAPGLNAWLGYNNMDTDPATWTNWIPATFNTQSGNNDEFVATLTGLAPGTYYYAYRYQLNGGPFRYGGYSPPPGGGFWDGTTYVSGVLTVNCSATVSSFPYMEDFETGTGNWISQSITGTEGWVRGTPSKGGITTANSGANAMVTSSLTADYGSSQTFALRSPCFDLSSFTCAPVLSFWMNMQTEAGYDAMDVEYSTNGGSTWTKLGAIASDWYNSTSTFGPISQPKFSGTTTASGWQQKSIQLPGALAGQPNVRIRLRFGSDSSTGYAGFAIDDIELKAGVADASLSNLMAPATACALTANETVTVQVNNVTCPAIPAGAASVTLAWTGAATGNITLSNTAEIAAGGNEVLTFTGVDLSTDGDYNFTATLTYTGDPVSTNNSATGNTTNRVVPVVSAAATDTDLCAGESTDLSASVSPAPAPGTATIGTGSTSESSATPYRRNWFGGQKLQLLYTAAELTAAGLSNGSNISALAFNVLAAASGSPNMGNNFTISYKLTSTSSLASAFETGLTLVYGPQAGVVAS